MTPVTPPSRRALLTGAAALAPLVALGGGAALASPSDTGSFTPTAGLEFIDGSPWNHIPNLDAPHRHQRSVDFRFRTANVKVFNPSLRVTVPPSYRRNDGRTYPVLLLLHGGWGMFHDWTHQGNVIDETAKNEVIVVMPDGGAGSFYSNANFPNRNIAGWEDYIIHQVLPFVHANFRTDPNRVGIAGLSMGGFGALALGHKYYGHFKAVSAYSGPADTFNPAVRFVIWAGPAGDHRKYFMRANSAGATWGHSDELHRMYNPMEHLDRYHGKRLYMRVGNGVNRDLLQLAQNAGGNFQESVVKETNKAFVAAAGRAGLEVDYAEWDDLTHDWPLWNKALSEDLPQVVEYLNR